MNEFSSEPIPLVQRSNLKLAWQSLQTEAVPSVREGSSGAAASTPNQTHEGSWSESFAPKIQSSTVAKLKKQFRNVSEDYGVSAYNGDHAIKPITVSSPSSTFQTGMQMDSMEASYDSIENGGYGHLPQA